MIARRKNTFKTSNQGTKKAEKGKTKLQRGDDVMVRKGPYVGYYASVVEKPLQFQTRKTVLRTFQADILHMLKTKDLDYERQSVW